MTFPGGGVYARIFEPWEHEMLAGCLRSSAANRLTLAAIAIIAATPCVAHEAPDMPGSELYRIFCASCHGNQGYGDGPVAAILKPAVPDLTRIAARNGGTFPVERVRATIDGQSLPRSHGRACDAGLGLGFLCDQ